MQSRIVGYGLTPVSDRGIFGKVIPSRDRIASRRFEEDAKEMNVCGNLFSCQGGGMVPKK